MRTCNLRRSLCKALTGVALVMLAPAGVAGPSAPTETQVASLAARADPSAASSTVGSPFTLYVEDPSGNAFRLIRVEGSGWKVAHDTKASELLREVSYEPSKSERPAEAVTSIDEPLTVFIDGASGFTYVYNQDGGWKFVGKLVDRRD
jgi:hypothetical protein